MFICALTVLLLCLCPVSAADYPESPHNYAEDSVTTWEFRNGVKCDTMAITFDKQTSFEDGKDFLYIFNDNGERIQTYTGKSLAGATIYVPGHHIYIRLWSGADGVTDYGFKITKVEPLTLEQYDARFGITDGVITAFYGNHNSSIALDIPSTITNHTDVGVYSQTITGIAPEVFKGRTFASVKIPETVTSIGTNAFAGVSCPKFVKSIDCQPAIDISRTGVFYIYDNEEVGMKYSFDQNGEPAGLEAGCANVKIEKAIIPEGVTFLRDGVQAGSCFGHCQKLKTVQVPASVQKVGNYAFAYDENLMDAVFANPETVFGENVFVDSPYLVVRGPMNSTAHTYADEHSLRFLSTDGGEAAEPAENFEYEVTNALKREIKITGYKGKSLNVVVPNYIGLNKVTAIGENAFAGKDFIAYVTLPDTVETIEDYAFCECTLLRTISIPKKVKKIGSYAFLSCFSLSSVQFPDSSLQTIGSYAFDGCYRLTDVPFPASLKTIEEYAFHNCDSLEKLALPTSLRVIGTGAFSSCDALSMLEIPEGVTIIGSAAFEDCAFLQSVTLPETLTEIGAGAFRGCSLLPWVKFPQSLQVIGASAFTGCESLNNIEIPGSVAVLQENTFAGCASLTTIAFNNGLTRIENGVFRDCNVLRWDLNLPRVDNTLQPLALPGTLQSIGDFAFSGCDGLSEMVIPDGVTYIGNSAFSSCDLLAAVTLPGHLQSLGSQAFEECTGLKGIVIPDSVTQVGYHAFAYCTALSSATVPAVAADLNRVFYECTGLKELTLTETVTDIADGAFQDATTLETVNLPSGLLSIGASAFAGCGNLKNIELPDGLRTIGESAFDSCSSLGKNIITVQNGDKTEKQTVAVEFVIPDSVTSTGDNAFASCGSLSMIKVPASAANLTRVFDGCGRITKVTLSDTVTTIEDEAFRNYRRIEEVVMSPNLQSIGSYAFSSCSGLTALELPESLETIGDYAFENCDGLTEMVIPGKTASVGDHAFFSCGELAQVTMEEGVQIIGPSAFEKCDALTSADLPDSLTEIGDGAFPKKTETLIVGCKSYARTWAEEKGYPRDTGTYHYEAVHRKETVDPAVEATCTETGLTEGSHCAACEEILVKQETVPALGHDFPEPTYTWKEDYSTVTATRTCSRCKLEESETAKATGEVTSKPTCTDKGKTTYKSAAYKNTAFTVQTQTVENIDALGHDWQAVTYTWAEDHSTLTATRACGNDQSHNETETVNASWTLTRSPEENAKGERTYVTEAFTNPAFAVQQTTEADIPALADMNVLRLPAQLTTVGEEAFTGDTSLMCVIIPEGCTAIEAKAFADCTNLLYVRIPSGVTVADDAFDGCGKVVLDVK